MAGPLRSRFAVAVLAGLLAAGSSAGAVRADETPHDPVTAPVPTTESGHDHEVETPELSRRMAGGNARRYEDGQRVTYRVTVDQRLQPRGRYEVEPLTGSLEVTLTESVEVDGEGPLVTLEVTEANAQGFHAEAEERAALERRVRFRPDGRTALMDLEEGPDGKPNVADEQTVAPFGKVGEIRMIDAVVRAHLLNPVIPADDWERGQSFDDTAFLPVGWILGVQSYTGSSTVTASDRVDGRDVLSVSGIHVSPDATVRVRAIDNAVDALQGKVKPEPNEFFAGTMFDTLFPEGSTYESVMPPLPLTPVSAPQPRRSPAPAPRRKPRRHRAGVVACLLVLVLAGCTDPRLNPNAVSLNLSGPMEMHHSSVVDEATGIVVRSEVKASAKLDGAVHEIPAQLMPLLPEHLTSLSEQPIGIDGEWTITEELAGPLPEVSLVSGAGGAGIGLLLAAAAVVLGLVLVMRRRRRSEGEGPAQPAPEPEPEPEPATVD